jgi:hypothetical protein
MRLETEINLMKLKGIKTKDLVLNTTDSVVIKCK